MNNLKELTKEEHRRAERTAFMGRMIKKQITPFQYYTYLKNQIMCYIELEYRAVDHGHLTKFDGLFDIQRSNEMLKDIMEMELEHDFPDPYIADATHEYRDYITSIKDDGDKLLAHIYVRHMGDLSGGQIIKRFIPGPTNVYNFEGDPEDLKNKMREKLHDGLVDEAKICFNMVQKTLEELEQHFNGTSTLEETK